MKGERQLQCGTCMAIPSSNLLRAAHGRLAGILGEAAEPFEVLERVEEHRVYWRPLKPRVVLLAESHVYTVADELRRSLRPTVDLPTGLPGGFVRLPRHCRRDPMFRHCRHQDETDFNGEIAALRGAHNRKYGLFNLMLIMRTSH